MSAATASAIAASPSAFASTDRHVTRPQKAVVGFWIATAIFCLHLSFTAYYELFLLPDAAQAFARLGFPADFFRIELSWAKVAGVVALLIPGLPSRLKEWAYAGFAFNLVSAWIAHASTHDIPLSFVPSTIAGIFWLASYVLWHRLQAASTTRPTSRSLQVMSS